MTSETQTIVVELVSDTSQLQPAEDKLVNLGKIDQQSATIFKQTNDQLKQRNVLLNEGVSANTESAASAQKQQQIYDKLAASVKNLSGASKDAVQSLLKLSPAEVAKGFEQAAVDVDDYIKVLESLGGQNDKVVKSSQSVRAELRQITDELARLAANGQIESEQFQTLSLQAGKLRNALDDTRETVGNLGKDAPKIQLLGTVLQGITGGFTAATGAAALFGDENKDLQETLVKVNSVMAINAGLTQLIEALKNESSVSTAKAIALQTVQNAQTAIQNGLESESIVIRTLAITAQKAATVAQYALNVAMSLNPVVLFTVEIAALAAAIYIYTQRNIAAVKSVISLNSAIDNADKLLDAYTTGVKRANDVIISGLEARNARESEVNAQSLNSLKQDQKERLVQYSNLQKLIEGNQNSTNADVIEATKKANETAGKLYQDIADAQVEIEVKKNEQIKQLQVEALQDQAASIQGRLSLAVKNSNQEFALQRQLAAAQSAIDIQAAGDDAQKIFAIRSALARQLKDIDIAQAAVAQDAISAANESALIKAQNASRAINDRTTQEEIDIQKAGIIEVADFQAKQEGLTEQRRQQIRADANQKAIELQRNFDLQVTQQALEDEISRNNKVLSNLRTSDADRLALQIANIADAAAAEIAANRGKNAKIEEIEAKRDADIKAARLQSIKQTLAEELELQDAQQAGIVRNIEDQLAAQDKINGAQGLGGDKAAAAQLNAAKLNLTQQKALIDQLTNYKLQADQKQLDSLDEQYAQGLISEKDYNLESAKLIDQAAKDFEGGEKRKEDAAKKTADLAKQHQREIVAAALDGAAQGVQVLQSLYTQQSQAAQNQIDAQRANIQALQDAGDISAKEAAARNLKLDQQQRQLQIQQAKRDKELALFAAIIGTAQAVVNAITTGDPYTAALRAAIAGAIGAAQIAVIASRPLPQFGKGKKGNYSGLAEVGETGPEIIKRGSRMEYVNKSTITWLGASDKVYNPKETTDMLDKMVPNNYYPGNVDAKPSTFTIDYDKMGKAIGKNIPQSGIGFDEQGLYQWTQTQQSFTKMLAQRRRWKK